MKPGNLKNWRWRSLILVALGMVGQALPSLAGEEPALRPWPENPWYWSYRGEPVLLLGGSDDDNLFQWPEDLLIPHLDRLAQAGGNVIRNTMSDRKDVGFEVYPYARLEDGRYDLDQWNEEYWTRFDRLLRETAKRGIFIQIEVWDRFDYSDVGGATRWRDHPYNPRNNTNYSAADSGLADRYPDHPGQNRQPFFKTTPKQQNNQVLLPFQQRFVRKMLEYALDHDHVLYCIDNETSGAEEWSRYWANFLRKEADQRNRTLQITEMWDDWNLAAPTHRRTFDHPELYTFVDISQNNHNSGQRHWDRFLWVREYLAKQPRPINTTKTYGADGNKFGHRDQDGIERFWRHLIGGVASARFHRPDSGLGLGDKAVSAIRAARLLESKVPLWTVEPANELLSEREENEAYLAAGPNGPYAIYFPGEGKVLLEVSRSPGQHRIHWINIDKGTWGPSATATADSSLPLAAPGPGNWAAAILPESR